MPVLSNCWIWQTERCLYLEWEEQSLETFPCLFLCSSVPAAQPSSTLLQSQDLSRFPWILSIGQNMPFWSILQQLPWSRLCQWLWSSLLKEVLIYSLQAGAQRQSNFFYSQWLTETSSSLGLWSVKDHIHSNACTYTWKEEVATTTGLAWTPWTWLVLVGGRCSAFCTVAGDLRSHRQAYASSAEISFIQVTLQHLPLQSCKSLHLLLNSRAENKVSLFSLSLFVSIFTTNSPSSTTAKVIIQGIDINTCCALQSDNSWYIEVTRLLWFFSGGTCETRDG